MIRKMQSMIVNQVAKSAMKLRSKMKYPEMSEQEDFLLKLVKKSRKTIFGRKYNFWEIKNIRDFQRNVPIFSYSEYKNWIQYMLRGEKDVAYPGKIPWFAISSGTTGKEGKYIPLTKEHLKTSQFRGGSELLARYVKNNPKSKLFAGSIIAIGGTFIENPYTQENNVGYITAILQKHSPLIGKFFKKPWSKISFMEDREEKIQKIIETTVNQNITGITGQPSRCTQFLYKVLEYTWKNNIHEVRPNFELFIWWGMSVDLYREQLKELFPGECFRYYQAYNASEGFFAIQNDNEDENMMLLTNNWVFYEFIPLEEYGNINAQVLTLDEVELWKDYVLLITTNAGLWRYVIWDVVQFTSMYPYKIKISGRTKYYIDVVGEWTTVEYTDKALVNACKITNTIATDYTVGPIPPSGNERGAYERIIEFSQLPKDIKEFEKTLDEELQKVFSNYYDERHYNNSLKRLIVHPVESGTLNTWLRKSGKTTGQSKVPKLANHRENLDNILEMIKTRK